MKVKLKTPHTHDGINYVAGDEIEVNASQATWLADMKVIDPLPDAAGGKPPTAPKSTTTENPA